MTETISAVVVNYNAGDLLLACIDSLIACPIVGEIIVVDNASHDGSLEAIQDFERVIIIRNSQNLGFATACNKGIELAKFDFILFLNPDCTFEKGTFIQIMQCMQSDERIGMAGGLLVNPDGSEQAGCRRSVPTPWRSFVRAFGLYRFEARWPRLFCDFNQLNQPMPSVPIEVEALSGACMLVKREAIEDVGLWDEDYFLHCEDLDWCMRFRLKEWKVVFVPNAKVVHAIGACSHSRPIFVEWHKHKGMIRFYRKFFSHQYPGVLMWLVVIGVWFRFFMVAIHHSLRSVRSKGLK
ncbi:MAG: glycosyltransferase family 2 protein [Methylicorpusculum sp.]|uniref:glycosyltransferase family 2 protein n=1 Tax=Methylicorpusculum sp. TaxID=2713644 RepID=UPI00272F8BB6|nr:glycosyltransferase family 2 protein [Methylicorpusculum sp.]MDP2203199.1 glycosyltransferase family 2 protein [Methylicorpusculum sp.]